MEFTIYTLGDIELFRSALNGVAMMFTVAQGESIDIWASNSGWGLGMGALLGALMALLIMVYNGALKRQLDWRMILMPLLLYFVLTVPKATVVIQDSYNQTAPSRVDNIPFGLAFPLSIVSTITHSATTKLETVFFVPYDGFTKITDQGYVAPLKLLNAIRYTGLTASGGMPNLQETLNNAYHICIVNNDAFDENEYKSSIDTLSVFTRALQSPNVENRFVKVPTANGGKKMMSCLNVATYITDGINAYISGSNTGQNHMLSTAQLASTNLTSDTNKIQAGQDGSKQGLPQMDTAEIIKTIANISGANNVEIMAFMQQTILNPTLSAVSECAIDSDPASQGRCSSYYTSVEQWKEKAAADASGFVAIMRDGQNLLIVLSIILFPIMVVILVLQGQSAMKILGSYMMFTVSAFMWLPVASIINFYTHLQLHEELRKWNPDGDPTLFLSLKNSPAFYDAVSKKLELANHALASVPMICMGLFSGMLMTMNRLSDRWNTQSQNYDAKANVPDVVKRGPIAEVSPSYSASGMNNFMMQNGVGTAWDADVKNEASRTLNQIQGREKANSELSQASWKATGMREKGVEEQKAYIKSALSERGFKEGNGHTLDEAAQATLNILNGSNKTDSSGLGHSNDTAKTNAVATVVGAQGGGGGSVGVAQQVGGDKNKANKHPDNVNPTDATKANGKLALEGQVSASYTDSNIDQQTQATQDKTGTDLVSTDNIDSSLKSSDTSAGRISNEQQQAYLSSVNAKMTETASDKTSQTYSATVDKNVGKNYSDFKQNQEAISQTQSNGLSQKLNSTEAVNRMKNNDGMGQRADNVIQQVNSTQEGKKAYESNLEALRTGGYAESSVGSQGPEGEKALQRLAAIQTGLQMGGDEQKSALQVFAPSAKPVQTISNHQTSYGLEKKNEAIIADAQDRTAKVQTETADLENRIDKQASRIGSTVDSAYGDFDAKANRGVSSQVITPVEQKEANDLEVAKEFAKQNKIIQEEKLDQSKK